MQRRIIFLFVIFFPLVSFAAERLPIPRFVSAKSTEVNIRTGPNLRYPLLWVIMRKGEPLEVIAEFEQWRKVKDVHGDIGWAHESVLSGKRFAISRGAEKITLYAQDNINSPGIARIEDGAHLELLACNIDWCKVSAQGYKGWVPKQFLYGVYSNEVFKK